MNIAVTVQYIIPTCSIVCIITLPQGPAHDDTTCAGVIFLRELLRCKLLHPQQGPRIRSRDRLAISLSPPNQHVAIPERERKPPAEGITTAAIAFQHKSLSASPPCAGPSLSPNLAQTTARPPGYKNPTQDPKPNPLSPKGIRRARGVEAAQLQRRKSPAECHADSARLKNNTKGPRHAQCVVKRQTRKYARERESRQETRGMQYHWQSLKIMLGRSSCVGGPGIMNNDFYGNGKTTCRLGEKATQYAFAMRLRWRG